MNELYCDGGVIKKNPSHIGGTWAARVIEGGLVRVEISGVITPEHANMATVSNNLTEMAALVFGLKLLPDDWCGAIFSDSEVTLGRAFKGYKWGGVPNWLHADFDMQRVRLQRWHEFGYQLLAGHPTEEELINGNKHGRPVSIHNKWGDAACTKTGLIYYEAWEKGLI